MNEKGRRDKAVNVMNFSNFLHEWIAGFFRRLKPFNEQSIFSTN